MISVDPKTFVKICNMTPTNQAILVAGDHGIGKTSIINQISKARNKRLIEIFLGQMNDRGDLVGPSVRIGEKKFGFLDPQWWPEEDEEFDILLDELNRAEQDLHSPIFDFVLNGRIMGRTLPKWGEIDGPRVFAAVNSGDDYFVSEMDPALKDRFNMYRLQISASNWIEWAKSEKLNRNVINYLEKHDNLLWVKAEGNERGATPRGWHRVSDWMELNKDLDIATNRVLIGIALEGIIGSASAEFVKFCISNGLTAQDILNIPLESSDSKKHNEMWDDLKFNLSTMTTSDLISINSQMVSATIGIDKRKIEQYCKNLHKYLVWLVEETQYKEIATELYAQVKESNHAKSVYYCDIDLTLFFTSVLDNLNIK